jgi:hypothetical protein
MTKRKNTLDKPIAQKEDDILLEDHLEVQAAEDEIFGKDQNIIGAMNEAILEERRKESAEPKDQEGKQASKDEATGRDKSRRTRAYAPELQRW